MANNAQFIDRLKHIMIRPKIAQSLQKLFSRFSD